MRKIFLLYMLFAIVFSSCKKWEDKKGQGDDRLQRPYCNDPEAANYNVGFPGTPDNSVCHYPYEDFVGSYKFVDSTYYASDYLFGAELKYVFTIKRDGDSKRKLLLSGFCETDLRLTADRYLKAMADSTNYPDDSTKYPGQLVCNPLDTLSGFITITQRDSGILKVNFTVLTDTGIVYHTGKAVRQ